MLLPAGRIPLGADRPFDTMAADDRAAGAKAVASNSAAVVPPANANSVLLAFVQG
jgi:hypothetical protein